jgi:hypothetical protein
MSKISFIKQALSLTAIGILMGISLEGFSQKQIVDQNNAWVWYVGNHRLSEHWGVHTEYGWRRNDFFRNWMQSQIRVAAEYYTKAGPQFAAGYSLINTYQYGAQPSSYRFVEHRTYEQFSTSQQFGRFYTSNRFRVEQRWVENKVKNTNSEYVRFDDDPFTYRNRVRYKYTVNFPLTRKTMDDNTLFLSVSDEIFINAGREIKLNSLDQNRAMAAIGWRIDKNRNIIVGYLNQYLIKGNATQIERNHTLQVGITWGIDFRKKDPQTTTK